MIDNGEVRYTPSATFVGEDSFRYTVRDNDNDTSNVGVVTVTVADLGPPWQNQANNLDVNADEAVSPIDALLVINELNAAGSRQLLPPPIAERPFSPPPYIDVNGDGSVSPADALAVINFLNAPSRSAVAARPASQFDSQIVGAALDIVPRKRLEDDVEAVDQSFVASNRKSADLDLIASDSIFQSESVAAYDGVFAGEEDLSDDVFGEDLI